MSEGDLPGRRAGGVAHGGVGSRRRQCRPRSTFTFGLPGEAATLHAGGSARRVGPGGSTFGLPGEASSVGEGAAHSAYPAKHPVWASRPRRVGPRGQHIRPTRRQCPAGQAPGPTPRARPGPQRDFPAAAHRPRPPRGCGCGSGLWRVWKVGRPYTLVGGIPP